MLRLNRVQKKPLTEIQAPPLIILPFMLSPHRLKPHHSSVHRGWGVHHKEDSDKCEGKVGQYPAVFQTLSPIGPGALAKLFSLK